MEILEKLLAGIWLLTDGRRIRTRCKLSGTLKNSQPKNEEMVSMMLVDKMPIRPKRLNRNQRKRAGMISAGNKMNEAKTMKMPRPEGHRKRIHWEVKQSEPSKKRSKQS
jgi:hypothetical protein